MYTLEEMQTPFDVPMKPQDEGDRYCICRNREECSAFMICCDHCEEWFHAPCVGHFEENLNSQ
jgi:hypothetical protein